MDYEDAKIIVESYFKPHRCVAMKHDYSHLSFRVTANGKKFNCYDDKDDHLDVSDLNEQQLKEILEPHRLEIEQESQHQP
jgi:hypothetical protein